VDVSEADQRLSPTRKARLLAEIAYSYVRARRLLRRGDLQRALAELRDGGPADDRALDADQIRVGLRLGRVVSRVLEPVPVDSRCLVRSLVLIELLSRRDIAGRLVIGVKPGVAFGAHAWVELNGTAVLPSGGDEFARLVDL